MLYTSRARPRQALENPIPFVVDVYQGFRLATALLGDFTGLQDAEERVSLGGGGGKINYRLQVRFPALPRVTALMGFVRRRRLATGRTRSPVMPTMRL